MVLGLSHVVIATSDVLKMAEFFEKVSGLKPHYSNKEFTEFVLGNKLRIAFFKATG